MPTETHFHYDTAGALVGRTEIVRESPWDDEARAHAEALFAAEKLICPKCGNLREICSDPTRAWYPQKSTCYAKAVEQAAERTWRAKLDGKKVELDLRPGDGTHLWASEADLTPEDDFLA